MLINYKRDEKAGNLQNGSAPPAFFICAEALLSRRFRNEGDYIRLHPPYENNIPRCSAEMLSLRSSVVSPRFLYPSSPSFFYKNRYYSFDI